MWKIKENLLEDLIQISKNYLPDEFLCFLGGNEQKKLIIEIVLLPTINSKESTSININNVPFDKTIIGSFHSHPNGNSAPSNADKEFFKRYKLNIIVGLNIQKTIISFYNNNAEKINIKIIKESN